MGVVDIPVDLTSVRFNSIPCCTSGCGVTLTEYILFLHWVTGWHPASNKYLLLISVLKMVHFDRPDCLLAVCKRPLICKIKGV